MADLPADDLQALLRIQLSDWDLNWQKPIRTRKQYLEYKCPRPKKYLKGSGDGGEIWGLVPCEKTATCRECVAWEAFLHIERCWRGKPAMMIQVSGFGEVGSTIAETVGAAKVYRGHFEGRLRKNSYVRQNEENNHSSERRKFMTALALGDDYRASLTMFFSSPLSASQIDRERRRAEDAGLGFQMTDVVMREDIESAAPPALTINMEGVGDTDKTNTWTSSGLAYSGGSRRPPMLSPMDGNWKMARPFPLNLLAPKDWKREYHQEWDTRKSLKDNLLQREEDAYFNAQMWMTPCHGLNMETLQAIGAGENIPALIEEIGDYQGPSALLRDTAAYLKTGQGWRKAFRPVLDAAGCVGTPVAKADFHRGIMGLLLRA